MSNNLLQQQSQIFSLSLVRKVRKKIILFLRSEVRDVRENGISALLQKRGRMLLLMALAVPVVLVVRALRPLVVIRFGCLISHRIGHFAGNTELYLCERDAGMHSQRTHDIFYHTFPICNNQLKKMWDQMLHVSRFARYLDMINRYLPGGRDHVILTSNNDRDVHGLLECIPIHLSFTSEEECMGRAMLRELGISDGVPFVCFHSRDSAYLDKMFPNKNLRYHNYRDSNIKNFIPAAEELVRRGYFAVRTGAVVKESLKTTNPMIIDYATKGRSEFLDVFLGAKNHFYLGDPCGFHAIPMIFRRPLVIVNMIPLEYAPTWGSDYLFIPKKLWLMEELRFLSFSEILESGIGRFFLNEQYEQIGVEVVENTPEEITAVVVEMDERLKGTWQTTEEDEELQQRFWSPFKPSELNGIFLSRIGAEFLRQNRELVG